MKPLDLINTPLDGINLIEASAGTGKTYCIEGLFLRLILERQLRVDQILVVTFTQAATEELKERIRAKLLQAEKTFTEGAGGDDLLIALRERQPDRSGAIALIHDALVEFDRAPIFTIHGFCARVLFENAFESSNLFDTELMSDPSELLRDVAEDFWRRHLYEAPLECVSYFTERLSGPEEFRRLIRKIRAADMKIIPQVNKPRLKTIQAFRRAYQRLKDQWPGARQQVAEALREPSLSGISYGSLKTVDKASGMSRRDLIILSMLSAMDRYVSPNMTGFPLFADFEKFSAQKLQTATRKNHSPPAHDFFFTCDAVCRCANELETELAHYLVYLKTQLFATAPSELKKRKSQKNVQFFDDLLLLVNAALASPTGNPLAAAVRQKYQAALVDEFQDTDSVQYEIFSRLFSGPHGLLFMIGDPKQAIYSFRGADIFSYLKAARDADRKFTLTANWRSEPDLISAVNTLFSHVKSPFLFEEIRFEPSRPGKRRSGDSKSRFKPLTIWYLDSRQYASNDRTVSKTEAERWIARAVAEEIGRIAAVGIDPWQPGDMAVLVRTNRQARLVKDCLSARGLPSVLYSTGNIFDTREAMEIEKILQCICEPQNPGRLKAALAMDMMGVRGEDLVADEMDVQRWENQLVRIGEYAQLWQRHGFIRMFRMLLNREKIRQRLLSYADGERRLTNVLQLAEIIHQESSRRNLGMRGTLKWLAEQRDPKSPRLEEHQLRLESDAEAVNIVTIHKSKGLEYPVVFCPYGWQGSYVKDSEIIFHQADKSNGDQRLIMDLGSDSYATNLVRAQNELLAENIRLLYVALTRAKSKCYLVWGRINTAESSALGYLLHAAGDAQIDHRPADIVADLKKQINAKSDEDRMADLEQLAKQSRGSLEVVALPATEERHFFTPPEIKETPVCRKFAGNIDKRWKVSSYSSLVSRQWVDIDQPDRDALGDLFRHLEATPEAQINSQDATRNDNIASFPKGSRAGNFFHDIMEHLDYTDTSTIALNESIQSALQIYGFDSAWQDLIVETIFNVLNASLIPDRPELTLSSIGRENRINEMEFYFPLNLVTPSMLRAVFKRHGMTNGGGNFSVQLEELVFSPVGGFMKGYIDLVFQHEKRFFLVDWKSNYLGPTPDSYHPEALLSAMHANYYILQYHLYALALCQYLRLRQSAFLYETDFGGVFYLFIRGIGQGRNPRNGIFFDRPEPSLINALGKTLIPDFAEL